MSITFQVNNYNLKMVLFFGLLTTCFATYLKYAKDDELYINLENEKIDIDVIGRPIPSSSIAYTEFGHSNEDFAFDKIIKSFPITQLPNIAAVNRFFNLSVRLRLLRFLLQSTDPSVNSDGQNVLFENKDARITQSLTDLLREIFRQKRHRNFRLPDILVPEENVPLPVPLIVDLFECTSHTTIPPCLKSYFSEADMARLTKPVSDPESLRYALLSAFLNKKDVNLDLSGVLRGLKSGKDRQMIRATLMGKETFLCRDALILLILMAIISIVALIVSGLTKSTPQLPQPDCPFEKCVRVALYILEKMNMTDQVQLCNVSIYGDRVYHYACLVPAENYTAETRQQFPYLFNQ